MTPRIPTSHARRQAGSGRIVLLTVLGGAAALLLFQLLKAPRADADGNAKAPPPSTVAVATAALGDLALTFEAAGRAEARASVQLKSRVDGQVVEVAFREGQSVRKGQLMYRLDPAVYQAAVRQAEGTLARDEAQLVKLRSDAQRNEALFRQGFIAESVLTQSKSDQAAMLATLTADRAALDNARLQLSYCNIVAPYDGVAGATQQPLGSAVQAKVTTLVVINQMDPIYVSFPVPEARLEPLKQAAHRGPVQVIARAQGAAQPFQGSLSFVDNAVDATSGSILAKATLDNHEHELTPGQYLSVTVQLAELHQVLTVPSEAVESGLEGPYAFVIGQSSTGPTVSVRQLKVGQVSAGRTVVVGGLKAGDRVVTSGQARLREGDAVQLSAATKPAP